MAGIFEGRIRVEPKAGRCKGRSKSGAVGQGKQQPWKRKALSRQISIGYFRRRISPSALTIREQKQWDPSEARSARSQYRI